MKKIYFILFILFIAGVSIYSIALLYNIEDSYGVEININEMQDINNGEYETYIVENGNLEEIIYFEGVVSSDKLTPIISYTIDSKKSEISNNININETVEKGYVFAEYNGKRYSVDTRVKCVDIIENEQTTVYEFYDYSSVYISANVSEKDVDKISKGQQVELTNYNGEYSGVINFIDYFSNNGYVEVKIALSNNDDLLRIGGLCECKLVLEEKENVLVVPNYYVMYIEAEDTYKLQRKVGEGFVLENVSVGIIGEDFVEILRGIGEGETIITPRYEMSLAYYLINH